jgi:hypothetical protein
MINFEELNIFFDEIIESDNQIFQLDYKETFKENGEVKTNIVIDRINLQPIENIYNLFETGEIEKINYYPKTFFKKLFNIKRFKYFSIDGSESDFILCSEKTSKIIKTNCRVYNYPIENKIIFGKRGRLIYYKNRDKFFAKVDSKNFKIYLID